MKSSQNIDDGTNSGRRIITGINALDWFDNFTASTKNQTDRDGGKGARKIVDTVNNGFHDLVHPIDTYPNPGSILENTVAFMSFEAKAAGRHWVYPDLSAVLVGPPFSNDLYQHFDIQNGVVGVLQPWTQKASVEPLGDGWFLCRAWLIVPAVNFDGTQSIALGLDLVDDGVPYAGDGVSGALFANVYFSGVSHP